LSSVMTEIQEMDRLIGLILQLSKLEMKETAARREVIDIAAVTASLLEHYEAVIHSRDLAVKASLPPPGLLVTGVADDLRTAVQNILDNAFRYAPRGGIVTVRAGGRGENAVLAVANESSLDPSECEKIFLPFYRSGSSEEQGYGLGLAITRKIAALHGGDVRAEKEGGTITVTMTIPLSG
ncbi:MAG: HAMP domain-containing histidine kinase, partial [Spirochaetes bacterium]|nr:HAMP domain-containing histidine kinase [Spirochaetota bacterium]